MSRTCFNAISLWDFYSAGFPFDLLYTQSHTRSHIRTNTFCWFTYQVAKYCTAMCQKTRANTRKRNTFELIVKQKKANKKTYKYMLRLRVEPRIGSQQNALWAAQPLNDVFFSVFLFVSFVFFRCLFSVIYLIDALRYTLTQAKGNLSPYARTFFFALKIC